jgi:hypothetical protein
LKPIADHSVSLVVSSPPYPGVYDYARQHAARLRWLGLDGRGFSKGEIGARRQLGRGAPVTARADFERDFAACLGELARVLEPRGAAALVLGDGVVGDRPLTATDLIRRLAHSRGLAVTAQASQRRSHFHAATRRSFGAAPREEHLFLLRPR